MIIMILIPVVKIFITTVNHNNNVISKIYTNNNNDIHNEIINGINSINVF